MCESWPMGGCTLLAGMGVQRVCHEHIPNSPALSHLPAPGARLPRASWMAIEAGRQSDDSEGGMRAPPSLFISDGLRPVFMVFSLPSRPYHHPSLSSVRGRPGGFGDDLHEKDPEDQVCRHRYELGSTHTRLKISRHRVLGRGRTCGHSPCDRGPARNLAPCRHPHPYRGG
ncbi:hypothetical protein J2129_000375 [Methanofollis sp. W23]|nr:hypothetical protein [Methanofollis sp. W23]